MSGMSENSDLKNVGIVAVIIGGTVLLLGLIGVALTLTRAPSGRPGLTRETQTGRYLPRSNLIRAQRVGVKRAGRLPAAMRLPISR